MGLKWTVLLFVGVLLSCGSCLDWQGGGNFTQANLTVIRGIVDNFDLTAYPPTYAATAATISTGLNNMWAPAWNVVIVYFSDTKNYDAVLYGYGFNGHWFWFNGMQTVNGVYFSIIIWKDFNCVEWITYDPAGAGYKTSSFGADTTAITNTLKAGFNSRSVSDIWAVAQDIQAIVPTANTATIFQDKLAYSVIAAQSSSAAFFGKVCAKNFIDLPGVANKAGGVDGKVLILQMRSS